MDTEPTSISRTRIAGATAPQDTPRVDVQDQAVTEEPYYREVGHESELFLAAAANKIPVLLKGPTGCGKTRFVEYMTYRLGQIRGRVLPLITVACHEDLTASDLVGRYILRGGETPWVDGPLTRAVRTGGICYLDEVVESRTDTTVLIHPLTDHRRLLPIERLGETITAHEDFMLVISYNPGYQSILKDLKQSTRQRFAALEFDYPPEEIEREIIRRESSIDAEQAESLARLGNRVRALTDQGLQEGVSTRLLIYSAQLIVAGIAPREACRVAVVQPITDDAVMQQAVAELVDLVFPDADPGRPDSSRQETAEQKESA